MKKLQEQIKNIENKITDEETVQIIARITLTEFDDDHKKIRENLKKRNFNLTKTEELPNILLHFGKGKKETWEKYLGTMTI